MNLIYFTISGNKNYLELLGLCLRSIRKFGNMDVDLLFITSVDWVNDIEKLCIAHGFTPAFLLIEHTDHFHSSSNKLKIYQFKGIGKYDKILFLDCDMLIVNDLNKIVTLSTEGTIQISHDNHHSSMSHEYYGGDLFDPSERQAITKSGVVGINAGIFFFDKAFIKHFQTLDSLVEEYYSSGMNLPICLEQPFFNVFLYRNKNYRNDLDPFICHQGYTCDIQEEQLKGKLIVHFCGGPGNYSLKLEKMRTAFNRLESINSYKPIESRQDILSMLPKGGRVAELGVFQGDFSEEIMSLCMPTELHLIDMWEGEMCSGDKDGKNIKFIEDMSLVYMQLCEKYGTASEIKIHRGKTVDILNAFPDGYFDWVYIDADHSYDGVKGDLQMSLLKVKKGGAILGHDYSEHFPGVIKAVDEFCQKNNLRLSFLTRDGCPTYLIKI